MAKILDLVAQPRTITGTGAVNRLRKTGTTPAVVYGRKVAPVNVQVDTKTFTKILQGGITHIDFHAIAFDEEIHAEVPVEVVGEAPGLKFGGIVEAIHHSLEVRCLPKDLPEHISIDVSHLNLGESVHVGEIKLPEGVRAKLGADVVIVTCVEPKVEAEPEPAAAAAAAKPAAGAKAPAAAPAAAKAPAKK